MRWKLTAILVNFDIILIIINIIKRETQVQKDSWIQVIRGWGSFQWIQSEGVASCRSDRDWKHYSCVRGHFIVDDQVFYSSTVQHGPLSSLPWETTSSDHSSQLCSEFSLSFLCHRFYKHRVLFLSLWSNLPSHILHAHNSTGFSLDSSYNQF